MNDELKPCPFCGGRAKMIDPAKHPHAFVLCTMCEARSRSEVGNTQSIQREASLRTARAKATKKWNAPMSNPIESREE